MRLSILALFFLLLLILPVNAIGEPEFEESDCEFDEPSGAEIDCGYLIVPENRNDPDSDDIRIHVAILRNPNEDVEEDPIIYLEGGPGGSALKYLSFSFADRYEPLFVTNRDIIVFDQRGIGLSEPALDCPDYIDLGIELADYELDGEDLSLQETDELYQEALLDCADELGSEHDLEGYNTIQNAADVEDLRIALGYDEVNLWGISYGTRLALGVMRDFPEHIRSVVIDSVYTPDVNLYSTNPLNFDRALTVLFDSCEADDACNELYPDLRDVFFETAEALNQEPVRLDAPNPLTGRSYEDVVLDGYGFVGIIFQLLYDTSSLAALPELIYDASNEDYAGFALMMGAILAQSDAISNGMYYAVQCNEEISFTEPEDLEAAWEDFPELEEFANPLDNSESAFTLCDAFDAGEASASENEAISSDIPTLVTTGEFDPITPPEWGALAAATLSNSVYINFPYTGHGGTASEGCAQDIMIEFFINPEPDDIDSTCVDEMSISFTGTSNLEVDFIPLDLSDLGIDATTLIPSDWEEQEDTPGFYIRGESSLDLTLIQIVVVPRADDAEALAELFSANMDIDLDELVVYEADNSEWFIYPIILLGTEGKIAISIADDTGLVFLMLGDDSIYELVLLPMLDAFELED
jgi:pimeloyl-ACP methyl ester carboxylesterase